MATGNKAGEIQEVLMDADAFVALIKKNDTNHLKAKRISQLLCKRGAVFSTTNYVFSEVVTVLSQKVGHEFAINFINDITSRSSEVEIVRVDPLLEDQAIEIFKKQTSKNVSFVDCLNMAVLKKYGWKTIFSFDRIYEKNGFQLAD